MRKKSNKVEGCTFNTVRKGYSKKQVDNFLSSQTEKNNILSLEHQARLLNLKKKCADLDQQLKELKQREDDIKKSLYAANDKANEMTLDLKIQYALEIERLKIFQAKWTNSYEELKERYHFGKDALNMESIVASTSLELENILARDFSLLKENTGGDIEKQFKHEVNRLGGGNDEELTSLFEKLKAELKSATKQKNENKEINENPTSKIATSIYEDDEDDEFDIKDALHPQQSLEDICKALGLNGKKEY